MTRASGVITRGTTAPNRLRRIDRWIAWRYHSLLATSPNPVVVDLGFGATPVTTLELFRRLTKINRDLEVAGLEIDPERVKVAKAVEQSGLRFDFGGFEIPSGRPPLVVRALNVLRQYREDEVDSAWRQMQARLAPDGRIVEGTCDEPGRLASWVELDADRPLTLTIAAATQHLQTISDIAPRLPKILIHHNVAGHPIHRFFEEADRAWASHSALRIFGARQRWAATVRSLRGDWPIITPPSRERDGEITIDWTAMVTDAK